MLRMFCMYSSFCVFLFFFFSSRRRHTRWNCDWSSDVCSSDLLAFLRVLENPRDEVSWYRILMLMPGIGDVTARAMMESMADRSWDPNAFAQRSEEHTSELQSQFHLVCRLLLEKKNATTCHT